MHPFNPLLRCHPCLLQEFIEREKKKQAEREAAKAAAASGEASSQPADVQA
jgi:hypothetical protein